MECLDKLIGITESECPCLIDGLTEEQIADLKESKSGLYLDNVEGALQFNAIEAASDCLTFAETAKESINNAKKRLMEDLAIAISEKTQGGKPSFNGVIGKPTYTRTLTEASKKYQYLKLEANGRTDGVMDINEIRIIGTTTEQVVFKVLKVTQNGIVTELASGLISLMQDKFTPTGIKLQGLPLYDKGETVSYILQYERTDTKPKDVKISCGCKGGDPFSGYLVVSGGETDQEEDHSNRDTKHTRGFSVQVNIKCDSSRLVCRDYDNENAVALLLAWSMLYKANELLVQRVLSSGEINRYTMMSREHLYGRRAHFQKEYEARIMYLKTTLKIDTSDCFICRSRNIRVTGIIS